MTTTRQVVVAPAWRASYRDGMSPVRQGWQVVDDGEWVQTFPTRREAEAVAASLRASLSYMEG